MFLKRFFEGNKKVPFWLGGILIFALLIEVAGITLYVSNSNDEKKVLGTSVQEAEPTIECFINGISVQTTRENCQQLSKQSVSTPNPTSVATPIMKTPAAVKSVATVAPVAPERKKVSIFIDDSGGITKGNFYCYEDKVNYLADLQNQIRIKDISAQACDSSAGSEGNNCSRENCLSLASDSEAFNACSKKCYDDAYSKCRNDVGDLRKKLYTDVHQYCP